MNKLPSRNIKYKYAVVRFLFSFFLLLSICCYGQDSKPYKIAFLNDPPVIDGNFSDWDTTLATPFRFSPHNRDYTLSAKVQLGWDEYHLFCLFLIKDNNLIKLEYGDDNPRLYFNDAVELYLDTKNNSILRMDIDDYQFLIDLTGAKTIFKGDKHRLLSFDSVPKEYGTANIVLNTAVSHRGTINKVTDTDFGYAVEFSVAWESIGIKPAPGYKLRIDACVNDIDSLVNLQAIPENQPVPKYYFSSWQRSNDFGQPGIWQVAQLEGSPDYITILSRKYSKVWLLLFFISIIISGSIIVVLLLRVNRLKQIPMKTEIQHSSLTAVLSEKKLDKEQLPHSNLFDDLRVFVVENLDKNIHPDQLAKKSNLGLRQLQRIFKDELGTTPGSFIMLVKLEKAAEMLLQSNKNITEISYDVGFYDSSYFAQVFKKYFNLSPKEFVKLNRNVT